LPTKV